MHISIYMTVKTSTALCKLVHQYFLLRRINHWTQTKTTGKRPSSQRPLATFIYEDQIYAVLGSCDRKSDNAFQVMWRLNPRCFEWSIVWSRFSQQTRSKSASKKSNSADRLNASNVNHGVMNQDGDTEIGLVKADRKCHASTSNKTVPSSRGPVNVLVPRSRSFAVVGGQVFLFDLWRTSVDVNASVDKDNVQLIYSDFWIFDFRPSLQTLCLKEIVKQGIDISNLPRKLQEKVCVEKTEIDRVLPLVT